MALKNPQQALSHTANTSITPLWRRIQKPFSERFLKRDGSDEELEKLYVAKRTGEGLEECELRDYIGGDLCRLFLVTAPAGLGKTTFLRHTLRDAKNDPKLAFVWIDVLRQVRDSAQATATVERLISAGFQEIVARAVEPTRWRSYFLEHCIDTTGVAGNLREELAKTGTLREASMDSLNRLLAENDLNRLELIRLRLAYLWSIEQRPVLVIDNVDQLRAESIDELAHLAFALAEGTSSTNSARVIMATRRVTRNRVNEAVGTTLWGELQPADINEMVRVRLVHFLDAYKPRILPAPSIPLPPHEERFVEDLLRSGNMPEADLHRILILATDPLLETKILSYGTAAELLQLLNHYNTRSCLITIGSYLASTHLPWRKLYLAVANGTSAESILRWPQLLHALFVGIHGVYTTKDSWVVNLFSDGGSDRTGVMIRARLLKSLSAEHRGTTLDAHSAIMERLFGYRGARVKEVWDSLTSFGALDEPEPNVFKVSDAGRAYLKRMSREFEYLQHVLMDAWTDTDHLVDAELDENASKRYERVHKFADWVRVLEIEEYRHVLKEDAEDLYEHYFEKDTLSGSLCQCLLATDRLANAMPSDIYRGLVNATRELAERCTFQEIRRAAKTPKPD